MIATYVVAAISFAIGYLGGRWNGVVHERDTLRGLAEEMRLRNKDS